jgi:hypothetical protein
MTTNGHDPEEARRRADEAAKQAAAQLAKARAGTAGAVARARRSRWLLDSNHLGELFAQALGLQK